LGYQLVIGVAASRASRLIVRGGALGFATAAGSGYNAARAGVAKSVDASDFGQA